MIEKCLSFNIAPRSSSPPDRHAKAQFQIAGVVGSPTLRNIVLSGVSFPTIIFTAFQLIQADYHQARIDLSLRALRLAIIRGVEIALAPYKPSDAYRTITLYPYMNRIANNPLSFCIASPMNEFKRSSPAAFRIDGASPRKKRRAPFNIHQYLHQKRIAKPIRKAQQPLKYTLQPNNITDLPDATVLSSLPNPMPYLIRKIGSNIATRHLLQNAKAAVYNYNGKSLQIKVQQQVKMGHGFHAHFQHTNGLIELVDSLSIIAALRNTTFELCNACHAQDLADLSAKTQNGQVSRDDYGTGMEKIEFASVLMFNSVAKEAAEDPRFPIEIKCFSFQSEARYLLVQERLGHTEHHRRFWDRNYLSAYCQANSGHTELQRKWWDLHYSNAYHREHPTPN